MRRLIITAALLLGMAAPAAAEVRILASTGGEVMEYLKLFSVLRQSGERVVIDGPCLSACTLVLSAVPPDRVCVTRKAVLGFHAARLVDTKGRQYAAPNATRVLAATYPAQVQSWIKRHGGLSAKPIFLRGRDLSAMFARCT